MKKQKKTDFKLKQADYWLIGLLTTLVWVPVWLVLALPVSYALMELCAFFNFYSRTLGEVLPFAFLFLFCCLWPSIFCLLKMFVANNKGILYPSDLLRKLSNWKIIWTAFLLLVFFGLVGFNFAMHVQDQYNQFMPEFMQTTADSWRELRVKYPSLAFCFEVTGQDPFAPTNDRVVLNMEISRKFGFYNAAFGCLSFSLILLAPAALLLCGLMRRNIQSREEIDKSLTNQYLLAPKSPRVTWDDPIKRKIKRKLRLKRIQSYAH